MSDSLRVRLEFKRFSNPELRNSLLSFKLNETKNVKSLQQLIHKRFNLQQNILLLIDGFVLEPTETIDVIRDNDLIVIEPKIEVSVTKVKTEPKVKFETKPIPSEYQISSHKRPLLSPKIEKKQKQKVVEKRISKEYIDSNSSSSEEPKTFEQLIAVKSEHKSTEYSVKTEDKNRSNVDIKKNVIITETRLAEPEVTSMRNIPLRKAFQNASTSLKKKPQIKAQTSTQSPITSSDAPKPKKRRTTKEAIEPVDRFSPIIILERQHIHIEESSAKLTKPLNTEFRKQSARKSFPTPSRNIRTKDNNSVNSTKTNENEVKKEKELKTKSIDFENCEPLVAIPNVGDIIAFKMLTLSSDGNGYESSPFKMGSVLYVNEDTQMVDILLQDVIKRSNLKTLNKSEEQMHGIHSLKINWSTVLEPKIVERQSEPELIVL